MLSLLKIKNLAIVEQLEVEFNSGLNIITGETGAGKSIILKAIALLGGLRSTSDIIRHGQARCEIEGLFNITPENKQAIIEVADELAELLEDEEIIIRRIVEDNGKGKAYLNSSLVPLATLQKISVFLFDITGQHQQQSLLDHSQHRRLLDNYGEFGELLSVVKAAYLEYSKAKKTLDDFKKEASEKMEYFRRLSFEREELKQVGLELGEREKLEAQISKLQNVEFICNTINESLTLIDADEHGVLLSLVRLRQLLENASKKDKNLEEFYKLIDSTYQQIREINFSLEQYLNNLEANPEQLESLRERLAEIARLERKYHKSIPELIEYYQKIQAELVEFEAGEFDIEKLEKKFLLTQKELEKLAAKLSQRRKASAKVLEQKVETELNRLNMKKAKFKIDFQEVELSSFGADVIEFMLAANPGEPFRGLNKVASGGELSRILLTLKTILNEKYATILQIFDEVDTGISGAVATVVGEKLKTISKTTQVLLITHSPQIAALADTHYVITKEIQKSSKTEKTIVHINQLDRPARIEEIAHLLAGKNITEKFREIAQELMQG
ncbi:MAG: DNA repair protein RecN [Deltaproteobacteria bacterium]|jgi:DNA repair protein RecN (Recombination protein N)|nr:DNA repair protein RecN [Deltaproteobacteria bacterium]